jgi:hypothetical protein
MSEGLQEVQNMISLISRRSKIKTIACFTLIAFSLLTMTSCVHFKVNQIAIKSNEEQPSISMKAYLKAPQEGQEDSVYDGVGTSLSFQQENGTFSPVASSRKGSWVLRNSPAGNYQITIDQTAVIDGKTETLEGSLTKNFTLNPGERADIIIVLKKVPVGVIVLISVLIVGLIILMIFARYDRVPKSRDLPHPPIPHLPGIPPPKALLIPLLIFSPPGRPFLGPPPIFIDGGFYYNQGSSSNWESSIETTPYYEPPSAVIEKQPQEYPDTSVPQVPAERLFVYPRKGQSKEQQAKDRYECHLWAVGQIGWDPTQPTGFMPEAQMNQNRANYKRAMGACLDAHDYTVK